MLILKYSTSYFSAEGCQMTEKTKVSRSTEKCLKVLIIAGGQHFWAFHSLILSFNSFSYSFGISASLTNIHLINWHEMPLFIDNIGQEAENNGKQSIKWQLSVTDSNNWEAASFSRLFQSCAFFWCGLPKRYIWIWARRPRLSSSLTSWPELHWNQQAAIICPFSVFCGLACFSRALYAAAASINKQISEQVFRQIHSYNYKG